MNAIDPQQQSVLQSNALIWKIIFCVALLLCWIPVAHAAECGSITTLSDEEITIADCENPFGATVDTSFSVRIDTVPVENDETIAVYGTTTALFSVDADPGYTHRLYRHTSSGYEEIALAPTHFSGPTQSLIDAVLHQHFHDDPDADFALLESIIRQETSPTVLNSEDQITMQQLTSGLRQHSFSGIYENVPSGTYILVSTEEQLCSTYAPSQPWWTRPFVSVAHAACVGEPAVLTTTFTIDRLPPIEVIDPLLEQYAPILQFHEDEMYYPMNVDAFVEASALWDTSGTQLRDADALSMREFDEVIEGRDTDDTYLAFSDPDTPSSIDLSVAQATYDTLVDSDAATSTVYVHKMTDGYTDSFGEEHEFIVLQYWFFYAMNNWGEQGGFNDHEGDWESVFVFLDAETKEPEYVAFSSHLAIYDLLRLCLIL